jgi:hypothetical protein
MEAEMKFVHTFSPWNTHVQMKALTPSLMEPADDREDVLFREALWEGQSGNDCTRLPGKHDESPMQIGT